MSTSDAILAQIRAGAAKLPVPNAVDAANRLCNDRFQRRLRALQQHFDAYFHESTVLPACVADEIDRAAGHPNRHAEAA